MHKHWLPYGSIITRYMHKLFPRCYKCRLKYFYGLRQVSVFRVVQWEMGVLEVFDLLGWRGWTAVRLHHSTINPPRNDNCKNIAYGDKDNSRRIKRNQEDGRFDVNSPSMAPQQSTDEAIELSHVLPPNIIRIPSPDEPGMKPRRT
jgi:hypothetical protein